MNDLKDLAPPEEIDVTRLRVYRFRPDDVFVIEYDDMISIEAASSLKEWLQHSIFDEALPSHQVLVLSGGLKLVVAPGKITNDGDYVVVNLNP